MFKKEIIVAMIASHMSAMFAKANRGRRQPKNTMDHSAFNTSWMARG